MADRAVGAAFLVLPVVASDLYLGNIHVLLAAAIVGSLRRPGAVGDPAAHEAVVRRRAAVVRRAPRMAEARRRARRDGGARPRRAVIAPSLWPEWIDYVLATGVSPERRAAPTVAVPLLIRLPAAVLLVIWGARTNRPWTLPTASMLALPVLWLVGLAMLAGAFARSRTPGAAARCRHELARARRERLG